jgi:hypothetical protein
MTMRFMLQVRANRDSESGRLPDREVIEAMFKFNEEMVNAGVMRAAEGLQPSAKGGRVMFDGANRTVVDGPFPNTDELIAGFWIIAVGTKQEAFDWAKRIPFADGVVEIRQIHEMEDFGSALTPEMQAAEDRMRARLAKQAP